MIELLLYIYFLVSIFYQFLGHTPFLFMKGAVWTLDILNFIIIAICLIKIIFIYKTKYTQKIYNIHLKKYLLIILIVLFIPVLIGIIYNNSMQTIIRDFRAFIVYVIPFAFLLGLNKQYKLYRYIRFMIIIIFICLIYFYLTFIFNIRITTDRWGSELDYITTYGSISHQYGIASALYYYPLLFFGFLNLWFFSKSFLNKYLILPLLSIFPVFYFSMRALSFGVLLAIVINYLLVKRLKKRLMVILIFFIVAPLFFLFISSEVLLTNPQVERHLSLLFPSLSTAGTEANREVRIIAVRLAYKEVNNLIWGSGYGDPWGSSQLARTEKMRYWNHSSIAWGIYKIGFLGLVLYFFCYFFIIKKIILISNKIRKTKLKSITISIACLLITFSLLSIGTNVFFKGFMGSSVISICLGLLLVIERLTSNQEIIK